MEKSFFKKAIVFLFIAFICLPGLIYSQNIDGQWIKLQKNPSMGNNKIEINLQKKYIIFSYKKYGRVKMQLTSVVKDGKVGMPRYLVTAKSRFGKTKLTILAFNNKKIYIGHGYIRGLKIWGTYKK